MDRSVYPPSINIRSEKLSSVKNLFASYSSSLSCSDDASHLCRRERRILSSKHDCYVTSVTKCYASKRSHLLQEIGTRWEEQKKKYVFWSFHYLLSNGIPQSLRKSTQSNVQFILCAAAKHGETSIMRCSRNIIPLIYFDIILIFISNPRTDDILNITWIEKQKPIISLSTKQIY